MTHDQKNEPIYNLRHAFEPGPIVSCFGLIGLTDILPLLEPSLYFVIQEGRQVGMVECFANGRRRVLMDDGTVAGPGCIIL